MVGLLYKNLEYTFVLWYTDKKGGVIMATSSIFTNVKITDPKKAEAFINALDASANEPRKAKTVAEPSLVTDLNELRRMMAKRAQKQ